MVILIFSFLIIIYELKKHSFLNADNNFFKKIVF
jgi:hypothetical protein